MSKSAYMLLCLMLALYSVMLLFTVLPPIRKGSDALRIGGDFDGPTGRQMAMTHYTLRGTITSNCRIRRVRAYIMDAKTGEIMDGFSYDETWDCDTYDIQTDGLDSAFVFRTLPDGRYIYYVRAEDACGRSVSRATYFQKG